MGKNYNELSEEENIQINYSGTRERSSLNISHYTDGFGKPMGKISGRRGRDDRPKDEESINKVRILSNRRYTKRLKYDSKGY